MMQVQSESTRTEVQNMNDRLLTRREAADLLRLKPQTLGKWAMTGRHLPVVHVGRAARYRLSDVQRLIARGSSEPEGKGLAPSP